MNKREKYIQDWAFILNEPVDKVRKLLRYEKEVQTPVSTGEIKVWLGGTNPQVLKETFD